MSKVERLYYLISSTTIALAVAIGAFGAHALKKIVTVDKLAVFETGVRYQMYVGLGLFGLALFKSIHKDIKLSYSFWSIFTGMIIFSGLLYLYVITGVKAFAMFVPIGGLLMILGWFGVGLQISWKTK